MTLAPWAAPHPSAIAASRSATSHLLIQTRRHPGDEHRKNARLPRERRGSLVDEMVWVDGVAECARIVVGVGLIRFALFQGLVALKQECIKREQHQSWSAHPYPELLRAVFLLLPRAVQAIVPSRVFAVLLDVLVKGGGILEERPLLVLADHHKHLEVEQLLDGHNGHGLEFPCPLQLFR
jgi:hypothetical protein